MSRRMIFDQYSRYQACVDLLRLSGFSADDRMLDVGSGPECLLGEFMPDAYITFLDPLLGTNPGRTDRKIAGDIDAIKSSDQKFDFVTCVDVLEHIPAPERYDFIRKLTDLSEKGIILGFPSSDDDTALKVDQAVSTAFMKVYGHEYSWLDEHFSYELPRTSEVAVQLRELGWSVEIVGHGHAPWLSSLLSIVICGWEYPATHPAILRISERFNTKLYPFDFNPPCYRQFVIARKNSALSIPNDFIKAIDDNAQLYFSGIVAEAQAEIISVTTEGGRLVTELSAAKEQCDTALSERDVALAELDDTRSQYARLLKTKSWRITAPLRSVARIIRFGLPALECPELTPGLRRLYHRLPIPAKGKQVFSRIYHSGFKRGVKTIRRVLIKQAEFKAPSVKPALQDESLADYIIWGVIDWHFRQQRPQHMARAIAASGRRVFYVSAILIDDARIGFDVEQIDQSGRLFQIRLFVKGAPMIYSSTPGVEVVAQLRAGIGEVLDWADSRKSISMIQHPFWYNAATVLPSSRVVYDCMDHHEGFDNTKTELLSLERALLANADLTVTTSAWLKEEVSPYTKRLALVRNAGEYEHFAHAPDTIYRDQKWRHIIGYYGAIAEWFDQGLVEAIAKHFTDCCILLVGADTVNAQARLGKLPNIKFMGEVPYNELPYYLHSIDVCLLPFKITPLTLATNPVKVYEYLSAGKAVVSVDLPEMSQFNELVYTVKNQDDFISAIAQCLDDPGSVAMVQKRRSFAKDQTWVQRAETLMAAAEAEGEEPKVSIIVVTYNNIELTRSCLGSIDKYSQYNNIEIIVVDNASTDGTRKYLQDWVLESSNRTIILNDDNTGFAAANNQGLAKASGEYLVLLNNDTYVTPGWIRTLVKHLQQDHSIGLIGPVTNNIGNEAKIDIAYGDLNDTLSAAASYTRRHIGATFQMRTAAFFCVMMHRKVYERVGSLDEAFGRGFFEDDDYCRRIEQIGLRVACAEDVFIHHHLSASFGKLDNPEREALFERNKAIYEAKWGAWLPHSYGKTAVSIPAHFQGSHYFSGVCNVCGKPSRFFYTDVTLWRESLTCEHCQTTSRYRSISRGIIKAIDDLTGIRVECLTGLPHSNAAVLRIYDTQPAFYYCTCSYPLPDILKSCDWIDMLTSQYKTSRPLGERLGNGITNQNLECLTFADESLDIVITSDVMEHVRLDHHAHREIYRVLKPGGVYIFTVPHDRSWDKTLIRVHIADPDDPTKDIHILEPEYHGDTNSESGSGVLAYRTYGRDLDAELESLGFEVEYSRVNWPQQCIFNTELYYCRKVGVR